MQMSPEKQRICRLLGQGIPGATVASAVGVDPSYISQLLSDDEFKNAVQEIKFASLTEATERDNKLNSLEDTMISRLANDVDNNPIAFKNAMERVRALHMINGMKRRGAAADSMVSTNSTNIQVTVMLPTHIINKFNDIGAIELDINNRVIKTGEQSLITMQSGSVNALLGNLERGDSNHEQSKQSEPTAVSKFS